MRRIKGEKWLNTWFCSIRLSIGIEWRSYKWTMDHFTFSLFPQWWSSLNKLCFATNFFRSAIVVSDETWTNIFFDNLSPSFSIVLHYIFKRCYCSISTRFHDFQLNQTNVISILFGFVHLVFTRNVFFEAMINQSMKTKIYNEKIKIPFHSRSHLKKKNIPWIIHDWSWKIINPFFSLLVKSLSIVRWIYWEISRNIRKKNKFWSMMIDVSHGQWSIEVQRISLTLTGHGNTKE